MAKEFDIQRWAEITIEHWKQNIRDMNIGHTGALEASIAYNLLTKNDKQEGVELLFNRYGKMADMGVGRGTKHNQQGNNKRIEKPWMHKQFNREMGILRRIIASTQTVLVFKNIKSALHTP